MRRRILTILVFLLLILPIHVFAESQSGSIWLAMRYQGKAIPGGTVTLYKVTDLDSSGDAKELADLVENLGIQGRTERIGENGIAVFLNLEPGQYLIVQHDAAAGYLPINPFCVSLPMSVGGKLVYDVDATPKLQPRPETILPQTGQLIWPIWVMSGVGSILILLGLVSRKRK